MPDPVVRAGRLTSIPEAGPAKTLAAAILLFLIFLSVARLAATKALPAAPVPKRRLRTAGKLFPEAAAYGLPIGRKPGFPRHRSGSRTIRQRLRTGWASEFRRTRFAPGRAPARNPKGLRWRAENCVWSLPSHHYINTASHARLSAILFTGAAIRRPRHPHSPRPRPF